MSATPSSTGAFRRDVEGIRAIAVLVVLFYHADVPGFGGGFVGVDIFFVVSGFLITGLLLRELTAKGRVDFVRFYGRRAKRLLPAGTLVLVVTAAATWMWLPQSRWPAVVTDIRGSALFVANWVFAARSTDYLGAQEAPSPVQHYWSLSVEEQFYFLWPALLTVAAGYAVRRGMAPRRGLLICMCAVLVPSLGYSIAATDRSPAGAYFSSMTRIWEMALGGVLALTMSEAVRLDRRWRTGIGWAGLLAVIAAVILIDEQTPFPGSAALVPTLGAAGLIVAGSGSPSGRLSRGISAPVMVWIGGLSYSLYLWHWPVLAIVRELQPDAGWVLLLACALSTVGLSWVSLRLIENPVRHAAVLSRRRHLSLMLGAGLVAVSLLAAGLLARLSDPGATGDDAHVPADRLGAAVLRDTAWVSSHPAPEATATPLIPGPAAAPRDNAAPYSDGCQVGSQSDTLRVCQYGTEGAAVDIVIAGDSHATSWVPTLTELARQQGWSLRTMLKSQCPLTDSVVSISAGGEAQPYLSCEEWKTQARAALQDDPPDLLLTTSVNYVVVLDAGGNRLDGTARSAEIRRGFNGVARAASAWGITPVFIADAPIMLKDGNPFHAPDCVAAHEADLASCATSRRTAVDDRGPIDRLLSSERGNPWRVIDLTDGICLPKWCPSVVGNVIVYRDYAHLTATYARSLAPWMMDALAPIVHSHQEERRADAAPAT